MKKLIQARMVGFSSKPVTVYAFHSSEDDICIVGKVGKGSAKIDDDCIFITDSTDPTLSADLVYKEDDINQSISDFFTLIRQGNLTIKESVRIADPNNAIEFDGIRNGKKDYRVLPATSNAQIGVLAICLYLTKQKQMSQVIDFTEDLADLLNNGAVTI